MLSKSKIFLIFSFLTATYLFIFSSYWFSTIDKNQGQESLEDLKAMHDNYNAYVEKVYGKIEDEFGPPDETGLVDAMKYFDREKNHAHTQTQGQAAKPKKIPILVPKPKIHQKPQTKQNQQPQKGQGTRVFLDQKTNPFLLLGVYDDPSPYIPNPQYNEVQYGIGNYDQYCKLVDMANIVNPPRLYTPKGFMFTDFSNSSMVSKAASRFSQNLIYKNNIDDYIQSYRVQKKGTHLSPLITNFFTSFDKFYNYHKIGQHYLCESQMSNHIPGQETLTRKDEFLHSIREYSKNYADRPECFNSKTFFPETFRLAWKNECHAFFKLLRSKEYENRTQENPIQYLVKIDEGTLKWDSIHLLDESKIAVIRKLYNDGMACGLMNKEIIIQKYISNPLLLDQNNRFDLKAFMLVGSTHPLLVFYHDGYLRVSSRTFNKSDDKVSQLPSRKLMAAKKVENDSELDKQFWSFERLEKYLLETKKIKNKKWLDEYLRPSLQKAFIHLIRMTKANFWKKANVYELFEMEFILDENLQLWFIESNPTPPFNGHQPRMIEKMLSDLFELQYAFYRSRMTRVMDLMRKIQSSADKTNDKKMLQQWKAQYRDASFNRLEPQFIRIISKTNKWKLITTERFQGTKTYLGLLPEKCL